MHQNFVWVWWKCIVFSWRGSREGVSCRSFIVHSKQWDGDIIYAVMCFCCWNAWFSAVNGVLEGNEVVLRPPFIIIPRWERTGKWKTVLNVGLKKDVCDKRLFCAFSYTNVSLAKLWNQPLQLTLIWDHNFLSECLHIDLKCGDDKVLYFV